MGLGGGRGLGGRGGFVNFVFRPPKIAASRAGDFDPFTPHASSPSKKRDKMKALLARSKKKLLYRPRYSVTVYGSNPVKIKDIAHCLRESVVYRFSVNEVLDTGTPLVEQLAKCDPNLDLFLVYDDFKEFVEHHVSRRKTKTSAVTESHFEHTLKSTVGKETTDVPLVILLEGREAELSAKGRASLARCEYCLLLSIVL